MGFENGFVRVEKKNNLITPEEYLHIKHFLLYKNLLRHDAYKSAYNSYKEWYTDTYSKGFSSNSFIELNDKYTDDYLEEISKDYIDYKSETVDWWCSIGSFLDSHFLNGLERVKPFEYYKVTLEDIDAVLNSVNEYLCDNRLIPAYIKESFKYLENGDKVFTKSDGILVEDEDGRESILYSGFHEIYIGSSNFDSDKYSAAEQLKECLIDLKINTDFDNSFILYYKSY